MQHTQAQNNASADNDLAQQVDNLSLRPGSDNNTDNNHNESNLKGRSFFEMSWTKKYDFFLKHGYELRPRFSPEWEPSWKTNGKAPHECEDYHQLPLHQDVIDATRVKDGFLVCIKRLQPDSKELAVAALFSKDPQKYSPENHAVPLLEVLEDLEDRVTYIVMPFLRYTNDPPFQVVDDVIDMVTQLLEGLNFMHSEAVAHGDCAYKSIMMDGSSLYPKGFHPVLTDFTPDSVEKAKPYARFTAPKPVRYYFVDFGISRVGPKNDSGMPLVTDGADAMAPELSDTVAYNPYKVDIYVLGDFFKQYIYDRYSNIEILAPFIEQMTARDPSKRPESKDVKAKWEAAIAGMTLIQRAQSLVERSDRKGKSGPFFLPFLAAGPVLLIKGWFSKARWTQAVSKEAGKSGARA